MPPTDKSGRDLPNSPEEKSGPESRLVEWGLLVALCVAAVVAGYFIADFVSTWMLEAG